MIGVSGYGISMNRFMTMQRVVIAGSIGWIVAITLLHAKLNLGTFDRAASAERAIVERFRVGYIPVTCHLTCPVTNFINERTKGDGLFEPVRFSGWPELKETFLSGDLDASFILAPMAIALREQGVPLKIVYLGHRDGTALMARKDSNIFKIEDLRGKKIAVPNRFSNQLLILYKVMKDRGMNIKDCDIVELPAPDMAAALFTRAVDAVISGEPFMAQTEMDGYGRVIFLTKDVWPGFISCVLAVPDRVIKTRRGDVQKLVDGIAKSGKWLDQSPKHRMTAAEFAGNLYYHQNPELLKFVLSKPPDRVKYTNLAVVRRDFEEIEALGREAGVLKGTARFQDYADPSFVQDESAIKPYEWEGPP